MRTPVGYENMIRDIARIAGKYGFHFRDDTLTDYVPRDPGKGHEFEVRIHLRRQNDDFMEDAPILISHESCPGHTGK